MNKHTLLVCLLSCSAVLSSNAYNSNIQQVASDADKSKHAAQAKIKQLEKEIATLKAQFGRVRKEGETPEAYNRAMEAVIATIKHKETELADERNRANTGQMMQENADHHYAAALQSQEDGRHAREYRYNQDVDAEVGIILASFNRLKSLDPKKAKKTADAVKKLHGTRGWW